MDSITTIKDTRIKVKAHKELFDLLEKHKIYLKEVPENLLKILEKQSTELPTGVETLISDNTINNSQFINIKLLRQLQQINISEILCEDKENKRFSEERKPTKTSVHMDLYLNDLRWLSNFLAKLRNDHAVDIYLHDILENCQLELPQNDIIKRNPQLEARCQKLREEQQNLEYRKMTKDVDAVLKNYPEDTVAYQIKAINSQLIAVLQFIFSVAAGFAFGFLGINLIVGNIEFGLRLLLGIMCALIIALAEIYFLAKKLNEYDNTVDTVNIALKKTATVNSKQHED